MLEGMRRAHGQPEDSVLPAANVGSERAETGHRRESERLSQTNIIEG